MASRCRWTRGRFDLSLVHRLPIGAPQSRRRGGVPHDANLPECGWRQQRMDMGDGIYDDGEWMCGACVSSHIVE